MQKRKKEENATYIRKRQPKLAKQKKLKETRIFCSRKAALILVNRKLCGYNGLTLFGIKVVYVHGILTTKSYKD
jgi:hypothetical protein